MMMVKELEHIKRVMHNAVAHDPPNDAQPVPEQ